LSTGENQKEKKKILFRAQRRMAKISGVDFLLRLTHGKKISAEKLNKKRSAKKIAAHFVRSENFLNLKKETYLPAALRALLARRDALRDAVFQCRVPRAAERARADSAARTADRALVASVEIAVSAVLTAVRTVLRRARLSSLRLTV
jgi:hypothetical protein